MLERAGRVESRPARISGRWPPEFLDSTDASEREFQHHAKLRLQSLFAGSPEGAHRWATLLGVVRTAQKVGVDVLAYLTWVFDRRGTHRDAFDLSAAELTPMAYRAQLETAALAA